MYRHILSSERLSRYKKNENETNEEIISRYLLNIKLSEAFYPALALFEITLRNRIDYSISKNINNNWLLDENITKFFFDTEIKSYNKVVNRFKKDYTKGQLLAELNLGFWVGLFKNQYNTSIWDKPKVFNDVFPNFQGGFINCKKHVYPKIRKIHEIRNRISHHEPIFDETNGIDNCFRDLEQVLFWLSPEAKDLLDKVNRFYDVWEENKLITRI